MATEGFRRFSAMMAAKEEDLPESEQLPAMAEAYVRFALESPALFRLMFVGTAKGKLPGGDSAYAVLAKRVRDIVPDAPEPGVLTCWATVHGLAVLALDQRLFGPAEPQVEAALRLLVEGLAARRG